MSGLDECRMSLSKEEELMQELEKLKIENKILREETINLTKANAMQAVEIIGIPDQGMSWLSLKKARNLKKYVAERLRKVRCRD
jgi:hypothetical protein